MAFMPVLLPAWWRVSDTRSFWTCILLQLAHAGACLPCLFLSVVPGDVPCPANTPTCLLFIILAPVPGDGRNRCVEIVSIPPPLFCYTLPKEGSDQNFLSGWTHSLWHYSVAGLSVRHTWAGCNIACPMQSEPALSVPAIPFRQSCMENRSGTQTSLSGWMAGLCGVPSFTKHCCFSFLSYAFTMENSPSLHDNNLQQLQSVHGTSLLHTPAYIKQTIFIFFVPYMHSISATNHTHTYPFCTYLPAPAWLLSFMAAPFSSLCMRPLHMLFDIPQFEQ